MEEQITFHGPEEIVEFDERCRVPGHLEGRKTIHGEAWILGRYLHTLLEAGRLTFPFTVERAAHSESPDFMLKRPDGVLNGVEVTEASTPEAHQRYIESEKANGRAVPVRGGDEREWAANVCERIRIKAEKLANGRWRRADSYDLVLYDNGPTGIGVNLEDALPMLRDLLAAQGPSGFRSVAIITASATRLVYLQGETLTFSIPPKRDGS